jgi:hypothetical protein
VSFNDSIRNRVDEFLIFIVVRTIGDSEALPMRFGREDGRTDIRHPDLNGPQSLPT